MATTLNAGTATGGAAISADTTGVLALQSGSTPTTAVTINASQNVGIGVTDPGNKLVLPNNNFLAFRNTSAAETGYIGMTSGNLMSYSDKFYTDSSGNLLIGGTSNPNNAKMVFAPSAQNGIVIESNSTSVVMTQILFKNPNGVVGGITTSGSATTYSTSSDYRLKENIAPMQGALNVVQQLKPVTYNWKADGSSGQGFIAHELQAVVPDCVTGEKDAVDEEGNPIHQGIDTSFLVATLTAAIQEQQAMIEELKTKVATLEAK